MGVLIETARSRGIGTVGENPGIESAVALFIDGVYRSGTGTGLSDLGEVERIEVLRGPQGTLYGKNTIGGAIKYISRGLPQETTGFASVTVGNYNQLDVKAALGGEIGGKDSGLRGRVSVASMNRDGFGTNTYTGQEVSDKEINAMRMQLGAYSQDDFDVQFAFDYMDDQSGVRGAKMLAPNPLAPAVAAVGCTIATVLLTLGLALAGIGAFFGLPVARLPAVDFPVIFVSANMAGASPADMARTVATPLERTLGTIAGVNEMTSSSSTGSSTRSG